MPELNHFVDVDAFSAIWSQFLSFMPKLVVALLLLLLGWVVARIVRAAVERLLKAINFDSVASKSGFEAFLLQAGIETSLNRLLAYLVYWMILLVVIVSVANSLQLDIVANLFNSAVHYIPNVIIAILVLVFGAILARFVNRIVFVWLNGLSFSGALTVSTFSEYAIMAFVFFVALEQLQIANELITAAFVIAFGAVGLAFAIAFGLGAKDAAQRIIEQCAGEDKWTKKK